MRENILPLITDGSCEGSTGKDVHSQDGHDEVEPGHDGAPDDIPDDDQKIQLALSNIKCWMDQFPVKIFM